MEVTTRNYIDTGLNAGETTVTKKKGIFREVVLMNLISNIMIKDNEANKSSADNKRTNLNQDYGFNLYKALEFSKDNPARASHNLQMEMICSKLI